MKRLYRLGNLARTIAGFWSTYGFAIWGTAVIVTATLGFIGFSEHPATADRDVWDRTYSTLQLVVLESGNPRPPVPWELEVARVAAPALAAIGLIGVASLFVQALTQQDWRLRWIKHHTIVCGLGERGSAMTRDLRSGEVDTVAVEMGASPDDVEACRGEGALIVKGDATDTAVLKRAGLHRADRLVVLCGADGLNGEVAANVVEATTRLDPPRAWKLELFLQLSDLEFRHAVEETLSTQSWLARHGESVELTIINAFERLADLMLSWPPGRSLADEKGEGSILIAGLGTLGESILLRAIEQWQTSGSDASLDIQVLDRKAVVKVDLFKLHYERIVGPLPSGIQIRPKCIDLAGIEFEQHVYRTRRDPHQIFVCVHNDPLALATAHTLKRAHDVPIAVRMSRQGKGLAMFLDGASGTVRGFGVDEAANSDLLAGTTRTYGSS